MKCAESFMTNTTSIENKKNKAVSGGSSKFGNLLRNWIHQGFFYLDKTEKIGWVVFELVFILFLVFSSSWFCGTKLSDIVVWVICFLIVHTINWVVNDNWWACILFAFPHLKNPGEKKTCLYLNNMAERLKNNTAISGVMIYGSIARDQWHERSDLDVRFLRSNGVINAVKAVLITCRERAIAFSVKQPLDVYLADDIRFLKKMRVDEYPIFLKKDDTRLNDLYPTNGECRFIALKTY